MPLNLTTVVSGVGIILLHQLYLAKKTKAERRFIKEEKRINAVAFQVFLTQRNFLYAEYLMARFSWGSINKGHITLCPECVENLDFIPKLRNSRYIHNRALPKERPVNQLLFLFLVFVLIILVIVILLAVVFVVVILLLFLFAVGILAVELLCKSLGILLLRLFL